MCFGIGWVLTKTARTNLAADRRELTTNVYDEDPDPNSGRLYNVGQLTTTERAVGGAFQARERFDYDAAGRQLKRTWTIAGLAGEKSARVNLYANGAIRFRVWPDGSSTGSLTAGGSWVYDTAGQLVSIPGLIADTVYDAAGRATSVTFGNGAVTTTTFAGARGWIDRIRPLCNERGRPTSSGTTTTIQNANYTRDAAGRITIIKY
mgnify:CR=1 FL=1|jgi:hypothetical protein